LIFYHFHQFQLIQGGRFSRLSTFYTAEVEEPDCIYKLYELELDKCLSLVREIMPTFEFGILPEVNIRGRRFIQEFVPMRIKEIFRLIHRY
jgi:hypothetical protein